LQVHAAAVVLDALSFLAVIAEAGEDVHADRRFEVLRRRPEAVIVAGLERQIRMRRLPDERAMEAGLAAALELLHRVVDVVHRDRRDADEAIAIDAAIFQQPVVVGPEAGLLQPGVALREEAKEQRRVEHFGAEAVDLHLLDPGARIVSAGALLESFAELVRREQRRRFAIVLRHALLPQIHRLHDMGVGRDDDAVDHSKNSPSRYTAGTRLFSFESPGIGSPRMLRRPLASCGPTRQPMRTSTSGSLLMASNQ